MSGGISVVVNFDALSELTKRLQGIQRSFESMGAHPAVDGAALGDLALSEALVDFLDGWSQGRQQISESLTAVVAVVSHALATYQQADRVIAADEQPVRGGSNPASSQASQSVTHG